MGVCETINQRSSDAQGGKSWVVELQVAGTCYRRQVDRWAYQPCELVTRVECPRPRQVFMVLYHLIIWPRVRSRMPKYSTRVEDALTVSQVYGSVEKF